MYGRQRRLVGLWTDSGRDADIWGQAEYGSPAEERMVKKFRRAAAGIDEQLPSDLRPPATLKVGYI